MNYINTETGQYPVTEAQIRAEYPNTSGPFIAPDKYKVVFPAPPMAYDALTHIAVEDSPKLTSKGHWEQDWDVVALPTEVVTANQTAAALQMQKAIEDAMTALFDTTAKARRYDSRITCALRAGYPGPFQEEGQAFAIWMDECNALGYQLLDEVQAGTRPMPSTVAEALALLPPMVWPV